MATSVSFTAYRTLDAFEWRRRVRCHLLVAWSLVAGAFFLFAPPPGAAANPAYLVSAEVSGGAGVFRLEDVNGDGDALDSGENVLWGRGISSPGDLHKFGPTAVLAADPSGQILQLQDVNGDGDALDHGESMIWANGFTASFGLDVRGSGEVLVTDFLQDRVETLHDLNGDGDALDMGERMPYAAGIDGPLGILEHGSNTLVVSFFSGNIHQLHDLNGDGDALDTGENVPYTPLGGLFQPTGIFAHGETLLVSARGRDTVYTVRDLDGDGDAMDVVEVLSFADPTFGHLDGPWSMTRHAGGESLLLVEQFSGRVSHLRDLNGDGDTLDIGETTDFAAGLTSPVGIVAAPEAGAASVTARLFYNNSAFDGNGASVDVNDFSAIAIDKTAVSFGETANFDNISGYHHGINGIFIDITELPNDGEDLDLADFRFATGNDDFPEGWESMPVPTSIGVLPDQGEDGSDRVFVTFADGAVTDTWLHMTVKANGDTGLVADEDFFFGAAPGETGASFLPNVVGVDAVDLQWIAQNLTPLADSGTELITERSDLNRDGSVNAFDFLVVAIHLDPNVIQYISPQMGAAAAAQAAVPEPATLLLGVILVVTAASWCHTDTACTEKTCCAVCRLPAPHMGANKR